MKLAEALQAPASIKKQISDLSAAAGEHKAAAESVRVEQRKLDRLKQDLDAEHAAHVAKIEREVKEHESAMTAASAELESVKKQATELKAKAEQDAAKAASLRAEVEKRFRAFAAA